MGVPNRDVNMKMGWGGEVFYIIEISKKPTSQVSKGEKGKAKSCSRVDDLNLGC